MSDEKLDIKALVAKDQQERVTQCLAEIGEILGRFECQIVAAPRLTPDGRVEAVVKVVSL